MKTTPKLYVILYLEIVLPKTVLEYVKANFL